MTYEGGIKLEDAIGYMNPNDTIGLLKLVVTEMFADEDGNIDLESEIDSDKIGEVCNLLIPYLEEAYENSELRSKEEAEFVKDPKVAHEVLRESKHLIHEVEHMQGWDMVESLAKEAAWNQIRARRERDKRLMAENERDFAKAKAALKKRKAKP